MVFCAAGEAGGAAEPDFWVAAGCCAPTSIAHDRVNASAVSWNNLFTRILFWVVESWNEFLCDGKWPAETKRARGNFESRRSLFAFVFIAIDEHSNVAH
jgi:hypothetical protein